MISHFKQIEIFDQDARSWGSESLIKKIPRMTLRKPDDRPKEAQPCKRLKVNGILYEPDPEIMNLIDARFVFTTDKSPFDIRCFPITEEDLVLGSFCLRFPLYVGDWGSAAKNNLTLSLDNREVEGISPNIVVAIRDQDGRKIGHFEEFQEYHSFFQLFFDLNDDLSAEATLSFQHPYLLANIKVGIPQETIQRHLSSFNPSEKLAFFILYLKRGCKLGHLPKVILPLSPNTSAMERIQPLGLVSKLLEFQKSTVGWMLEREGSRLGPVVGQMEHIDIPPIRSLIQLLPGFYFDVASGFYTDNKDAGQYEIIQGGILCDEMGMGKTLMVLSIILLNKLKQVERISLYADDRLISKATLIIVPLSILNQWALETEKNAPNLNYYIFEGRKSLNDGEPIDGQYLTQFDIVFTTYSILQKEIYAASSGREGGRRGNREVRRRNSPLMELFWYRVVLDEAQMVENTVSNASMMACKIPRYISWTVTGTPCPKTGTIDDMKGLFRFANSEIYSWSTVFKLPDITLSSILAPILHRDSKDHCKEELILPEQEDQTFYIPFTKVEEQYYDDFVHEAVEEIGRFPEIPDLTGKTYEDARLKMKDHEEKKNFRFSKMAKWFLRLRQTCCHPKASLEGKRLLGGRARTMEEVRDNMLNRCDSAIQGGERALVNNAIERGQLYVNQKRFKEAIDIYQNELSGCQDKIENLEAELQKVAESCEKEEDLLADEGETNITRVKRNMRSWKEIEHRLLYFIHMAYADMNDEANELKYYELATDVREKMLSEYDEAYLFHRKQVISIYQSNLVDFKRELLIPIDMVGGIITHKIFAELEPIEDKLNDQWDYICEWRTLIKDSLISGTDSDLDNGLKTEEILSIFLDMLGLLIEFRKEVLTAEPKNHPNCDSCGEILLKGRLTDCAHMFCDKCSKELVSTKRGVCNCPLCHEKIVIAVMDEITTSSKPRPDPVLTSNPQRDLYAKIKNLSLEVKNDSYKTILGKFKAVLTRYDLPQRERDLARKASRHMIKHLEIQLRHIETLERELLSFKSLQNARTGYYRQLKKIGISVTPLTWNKSVAEVLESLSRTANEWKKRIQAETSKKTFLLNRSATEGGKVCLICTHQLLTGYTFPCGHYSCTDCFEKWINLHRKCHLCQSPVDRKFCHKTNELPSLRNVSARTPSTTASELQAKIAAVKINESVGSKMNMVVKHITLLLSENPSVKILCFSQWDTVLKMFSESLVRQKIGYITLEGTGWDSATEKQLKLGKKGLAVLTFVQNPNVSCFLLHAKSQSAGLSLVAATHVFLLEPMLHKGLEEQAIGRIHRIGQTKSTFVWRYIIQGTVEEYLVKDCETEEASDRQVQIKRRDEGETVAQSQLLNFFEPMIVEKNNHLRVLEREWKEFSGQNMN